MRHLQREIEKLKKKVLALSAVVEENLRASITALEDRDVAQAMRVIATDAQVDEAEVDVEEECLKLLALYQPVAVDLRFLVAVIKIDNELERIGDLAANIAERAASLADLPPVGVPVGMRVMFERVEDILEMALDALVNSDAVVARDVLAADDAIDDLYGELLGQLKELIREHLDQLDAIVLLFNVARYLERLADHATNIGEDVIYMVEGEIRRHTAPDVPPSHLHHRAGD
jgi:phosphate transport system protein